MKKTFPMNNRQLFYQHLGQTTDFPLAIEVSHAQGVWMYSPDGKRYLDLISGIGVSNVGHCHPQVVKAVQEQAGKFMHLMVYGEFIQSPQVQLAAALARTLPQGLDRVYFVNSGSEAIEGAMKLAKRYTGRHEILSCHHSYHGSTHGALSISGNEVYKQAYRPLLPGTRQIVYGGFADLQYITSTTAAVVIETIQGEAGVKIACPTYFKALREACNVHGALLILDEIQCGMGRTGTFWAFEQMSIVPDIVVSAKALGAGMPIGAFISTEEIMSVLKNNPILGHITTFGGHPVSAAAALAGLKIVEDEQLIAQVPAKASYLRERLVHPLITQVRQQGLMMALEMENFTVLKRVIDQLIERGIITDWFLHCDNAMRIAPPLIISEEELSYACDVILEVLDEEIN